MEKIKLLDGLFIYKTKIDVDKESLLSEIYLNIDINDSTMRYVKGLVGIQSSIIINGFYIDELLYKAITCIKTEFNIDNTNPYILDSWVYQSENINNITAFHSHKTNPIKTVSKDLNIENEWTFTYYVQMPNNLKENDGYLTFKLPDNSLFSILPNEMELFVFPASLLHKPQLNKNSTIDRIVVGGNFVSFDVNKSYRKSKKTLI